jgi:hypothetical protein
MRRVPGEVIPCRFFETCASVEVTNPIAIADRRGTIVEYGAKDEVESKKEGRAGLWSRVEECE